MTPSLLASGDHYLETCPARPYLRRPLAHQPCYCCPEVDYEKPPPPVPKSDTAMTSTLDRFPRLEFTQATYDHHLTHLERTAAVALAGRSGWDVTTATPENGWTALANTMGWKVFARYDSGAHEYLCIGTLHTTLAALQEALYVDTTPDFRAVSAVLFEGHVTDAAVLNVTHERSRKDRGQFMGVKYLQLNVPLLNGGDQAQEHFYLEFAGTREDSQGRPTWVVVTEPVHPHHWPTSSTARTSHEERRHEAPKHGDPGSSVALYRELLDGSVQVTVRTRLDGGGDVGSIPGVAILKPTTHHHHGHYQGNESAGSAATLARRRGQLMVWKGMGMFIPSGLAKDFSCLGRAELAPEFRRLVTGPFATMWPCGSTCNVCRKSFNLLRRRSLCRRCGLAACGACTVSLHCVDRPPTNPWRPTLALEKFCKACLVQSKVEASQLVRDSHDIRSNTAKLDRDQWPSAVNIESPALSGNRTYFTFDDMSSSVSESSDYSGPRALLQHAEWASMDSPKSSNVYAPSLSFVPADFPDYGTRDAAPVHQTRTNSRAINASPMPILKINHRQDQA